MKGLAELVLSLCDLLEAEGRLLRENTLTVVRNSLFICAALFFAVAAIVFVVAALYVIMRAILPAEMVLAIMAVVCALVSLLFIWGIRPCGSKKTARQPQNAESREAPEMACSQPKQDS